MYKGYLTAFLFVCHYSSVLGRNKCDYICDIDGCKTAYYLSNSIPSLKFCTNEDIPNVINITLMEDKNETSELPVSLEINFIPPRRICKYDITLLANESINETKCMAYNFQNQFGSEVHTPKSTICFMSNNNHYQDIITMIFPYVFTACYAIQFHFDKGKYINTNKFLKTNYKRTEVAQPELKCTYDIVHNTTKNKKLQFEVDFSISIVSKVVLKFGSLYNFNGQEGCDWDIDALKDNTWYFDVLKEYAKNKHNSNTTLLRNGKYEQNIKFEIEVVKDSKYCFLILLHDERCKDNTMWKPPIGKQNSCRWIKDCHYIPNDFSTSQIYVNTNSYLYLPIEKKRFYINADKSNVITANQKCNQLNICALKNIERTSCESIHAINTDIVLLYPRSSESFMELMADFREILSRVCQCFVHDWYNGIEWNYVAEIGGSDWFAEMLNKKYRVIWIDTPVIRSLITRKFKGDFFLKNSEQYNFMEIGDFRDIAFPAIFNLAKRNVEHSILEQNQHFIVRLKGFESFENENDPFIDLSPHKRYFIPQDLNSLCTDLSMSKSNVNIPSINQEEALIKQHLHCIEFNFYK
ncbi:uncharacterized protein LOC143152409 isoform X2 [Ptiloglossa arizonensis]|uniref:uncharacterized protein LOC143152409 isoform X2 n=1 Tax=Ptiloglossa arizonensis TaxID=3350558 RepID=UPI003F9F91A3